MAGAHTSAADLTEGVSNDMYSADKNFRNTKMRGSATGTRKGRPMTAKVNKGNFM